ACSVALPVAIAQGGVVEPSKTEAEAAWNAGRYETAYDHYNGLLLLYSRDPLYKYYAGACLVKLERDIPRAAGLLASAINSSAGVKSVPDDVWFWYGRSLQMKGDFDQAAEAYGRFSKIAGRKVSEEYEVQRYVDECGKGTGGMAPSAAALKDPPTTPAPLTPPAPSTSSGTGSGTSSGTGSGTIAAPQAALSVQETVPDEYDAKLRQIVILQYSADSLTRSAQGVRREMESATPDKKGALKNKAEAIERDAARKQSEADSILASLEPVSVTAAEFEADDSVSVYSVFEVRQAPFYGENEPIPTDRDTHAGLVYSVQLAAFRNPVKPELFKGLYPVYGKLRPENGVTYYYTGLFRTLEAARQAITPARAAGFPDAFVIAWMDDVQVSMERAALLEKEWGGKPLLRINADAMERNNISVNDTLPVGTLTFRAEVMRSKKPVKPDVIEKIQLLAGTRGLDIIKNSDGEAVFLIGNFITFESADEYVSLLVRNGYSTSRVAAYVGMQEIPVEAAKELLKRILND
ncbi:MAG: SPOR domain-containing protein, partial [Bacteroidales bacterium]|nr:SPOR domain-containing protein [Bacteroidales bacterium]